MSDFRNVAAVSPMARTEKQLALLNEKAERMLSLLAKIEENTRQQAEKQASR